MDTAGVAADVGELAGVLFHVGTLDVDPEGAAVVQRHVEVAVEGDRLVILGDLVVLRLIRVEVVLPGKPAPRGDAAVQRQPDPNGRLDGRAVEHRQRSGQAQAYRAHLGVGLGAEPRRAGAEHLGGGRQLDVHLEAEDRVEPGHDVVVVEQINGTGDGHEVNLRGGRDAVSSAGPRRRRCGYAPAAWPGRGTRRPWPGWTPRRSGPGRSARRC